MLRNDEIVSCHNDGMKTNLIAKKFGISASAVSNILTQRGVERPGQSKAPGPRKLSKNKLEAKSVSAKPIPQPSEVRQKSIKELINETINNLTLIRERLEEVLG